MPKFSENKTSVYFPMVVKRLDYPHLFDYLQKKRERGAAKKFVCDSAEEHLKQIAVKPEQVQEHEELIRRLDEIRELLKTGVAIIPAESDEAPEHAKQSPKVSGLLSALGL